MQFQNVRRISSPVVLISAIICFSSIVKADEGSLGIKLTKDYRYGISIFKDDFSRGLAFSGVYYPILKIKPRNHKWESSIDSTGSYIEFTETIDGVPLLLPARYTRHDYYEIARGHYLNLQWQKLKIKSLTEDAQGSRKGSSGLAIDIPVKIKSKAFQTIFGGDRVGLTVNGNITINGGFRHEKRSEVRTAINRGSDYNFKMEQTQQFRVTGNIGDKVKVSVDQDSERPFDFENTIKLNYDGYEDEIVKKIEAGNISLSLPATRFVSFSGTNSGLFGVKTEMTMGNLDFTMIASQEKGENKKLSYTGGAQEGTQQIKDTNYMKGVYFFINKTYRNNYFPLKDGIHTYDPNLVISDIEIYVSTSEQDPKRIWGYAAADSSRIYENDFEITQEHVEGYWARLEKTEYFVATDLGYFRLNNYVGDDKMLAIAYRDTLGNAFGDINYNAQQDSVIHLKLIKPKNPRPSDMTWDLMFRHIYYLGAKNISEDGFEAKIYYDPPSGDDEETIQTEAGVKSWLEVFGFDKVDDVGAALPDNKIDNNANIIRLGMGELEFPSLRPFADLTNPFLPEDKYVDAMYDTTNQSEITRDSKFYVEIKSKSRSATIQLGFNVIEGSEEVRLNGAQLSKGSDYIIDYYSGTLTVLDERATSPSADLEVNYQRNELFQLEKKTLLGMRAEYNLWEDSFIGGTFLYLNQSTLDQKVRVGKGPMRNIIWDVNTALSFKPNFLTKAIDALPLIQTKQPSSLKFEGEIAQILPNPNTLNNESTEDYDGVAYIDDFEAAKKITPLGVIQGGWTMASTPMQKTIFQKGRMYWYNDYNMTPIQEIWPNKEVNPNTPNRVHVLSMVLTPEDSISGGSEKSWMGLMRPLSSGYADQSDSKFLEIWINGSAGRININLGQISEDAIPNGRLDTEDKEVNGIRNGLLDEGEDIGLDGMSGRDPDDFWDLNRNGRQDPGEPTSWDDWKLNQSAGDYESSNGTEGNENNVNGRIPDTEDINGNGTLDQINNYFEYSLSLSKTSEDTIFITGDNEPEGKDEYYKWYQYRIPLAEPDSVIGNPDMTRLEYVRVWFEGMPNTRVLIRIAEINLVGNDWKEKGIAISDSSEFDVTDDSTVVASIINTHENPEYNPPPGVSGVRDRITRVEAKEQSLVVKINGLQPGSTGILQKTFYQAEDYIHYRKMKMFIHGDLKAGNFYPVEQDTSSIELFMRFGADERNYYEIRQPVYQGWEGNNVEISLDELTQLKFEVADSLTKIRIKRFTDGREWRVVGEPSLTNVKQLILGVKNIGIFPFHGEIWVNELRLSEVRKDKGYAMRARADLKLADLINFNAEIDQQDADFHNINTRFGSGDNTYSQTMGATLQLQKFLPRSWGLSIPVTFNFKTNEATPKYLPGSDILVTSSTPDTVLEVIRKSNESIGYGISFRKTTQSNNFFVKHTLDNFDVSFNGAESHSTDSKTKESTRETYTANVSYSLKFGTSNFAPFAWTKNIPVMKKLAGMKFYYLPTSLNLKASGNQSKTYSLTRSGLENSARPFTITRSVQTGYKPFTSLTFDFSRTHLSDLTQSMQPKEELMNLRFGQLTNIDQSSGMKYNPKLVTWLSTNFSYTTSYKWTNNLQLQNTGTGRSASNNNSISGSFTFDPNKLITSMTKSKGGGKGNVRRTPARTTTTEEKKEEEKSDRNYFKMILSGLGGFTKSFQAISINYTQRKNSSFNGLTPGSPDWKYMFGFSDSTGLGTVEGVGTNRSQFRDSKNLSLQSGIKVASNIDLSFRFNHDESFNESTQITGDASESSFKLSKDTDPIPFPEWTFRWSGIEKLPYVKKFAQRVSFDHSFSGKTSEAWQKNAGNVTKQSYTQSFRPLIGLNMTLVHNITMNVRYNTSTSEENVTSGSDLTRSSTNDFSVQGSYSKSGGFRIPLPIWPFKNKEFKNNIDLSLTFNISDNTSEQNRTGKWEEMNKTAKWSFKPQMTYRFSNNVSGGVHFEYGKNESKLTGTTSYQDFGLNVRIEIQGR